MAEKRTYYQFNIDLNGNHFIKGIKISQSNGYFAIKNPTFHGINNITTVNDVIYLSTNVVVCYFEIENN